MLRLRSRSFLLVCSLFVLSIALVGSGRPPDQMASQKAAIKKQATAFVDAFQKEDSAALARFWAPDGDYIDLDGRVFRGREAIAENYAEVFAENDGLELRIEVVSVRFPTPDTAVEEGVTSVLGPEGTLPTRSRYTNVLVRRDGKWLLWSVRETPYIPTGHYPHLEALGWMIGDWVEDREGTGLAHVTFEWTPDQNYIIATRTVCIGDFVLDSGTERIGWDPAAMLIRSWSFEADGSFGEGAWTREGDTWTSRMSTVLSSGALMTSTTTVTRPDHDSITWQMTDQVVNGKSLPASPLVKMKRVERIEP